MQLLALVVLIIVMQIKESAQFFPFILILFIPYRLYILPRFMNTHELAVLD